MIHFDMPREKSNIIKVLGFGGGGGNAVNHMYHQHIQNVDFIICNTDAQALQNSPVPNKIQLGPHLTQGLGAGANPSIGKQATEESLEEIRRILEINTKMAFITAGMGGGTGTGGAPTVAKICRDLGILTVGIVTTPFQFEGPRRMQQARQGIEELKEHVDTLLVISNDKLRHQFGNLKMRDAFAKADDVLSTAARCITDVINSHGQINVDFADVCTVMRSGGVAILGSATEAGENRALKAIESATNSPLLNDNDIRGAKWILLNITSAEGDHEYTMEEVEIIQNYVREQTGETTDVILGMGYDDTLGEQIGITIIATGFHHKDPFEKTPARKPEVKQLEEPVIIMTLGVEGEEKKMDAPIFTAPEPVATPEPEPIAMVEETEVLEAETFTLEMPVMEESAIAEPEPEPVYEPPVMDVLKTVEEEAAPIIFELSVSEEPFIEETAAVAIESSFDVAIETPAEEEAEAPSVPGFLSKPAQIYFEPVATTETEEVTAEKVAKEEESLMPVMAEIAEELPVVKEEWKPTLTEEWNEEDAAVAGISLSVSDHVPAPTAPEKQMDMFHQPDGMQDLSEDEEQKRRAKERINRLRNLSYNPHTLDNNSEFEQVPAYLRRDMNLHNSIANVEDFYSRAQVKSDDNNQGHISTLNNFLHGEKPD
jgi:cell division protein FtsZ